MNTVAFTPARGGSVGVPRKNLRPLAGRPLLAHTVAAAQASASINRYIVNTEDDEIANVARELGVEVQPRPEDFWHDNTVQEVDRLLVWAVSQLEEVGYAVDVVVLLYATSPLRGPDPIDATVDLVASGKYDSALTLREDRTYLWRRVEQGDEVAPVNYSPANRGPNQLEGWNQWAENKAVYACTRDLLVETGCRLGGRIGSVVMDRLDSIDIDRPDDFAIAEAILSARATSGDL